MAAVLFGGACVGVIAFTCWRMNVNSYGRQKYVAMYFEESSAAEESKKESEKAEEEAFWAMPSVVELTLEQTSVAEVMTEMSLPTETSTEMLTDAPTTHETAPTTAIPIEEVQIITPTTNAPQIADISLTAEEEQLLLQVASCEAGNQGWQGMALVMNVVLNRRTAWGMSISDVIYAKGQFSVIGCDKWNNGFIAEEAPIARQAVKDGWDGSQGALFFCAPSGRSVWMATTRQYLFTAWGHEFYK
jgi:spore germination cell wall hydrolase CwlJ-like protein